MDFCKQLCSVAEIAKRRTTDMEPSAHYELAGICGSEVFTNGHIVKGDIITLYMETMMR